MDSKVDKFAPVMFQKLNTYENEDSRLLKVKIWLMHLGENLNGSYFDKEIVTEAIPTLANTPILAYIEQNSDDETDFSDHRMVLTKKDGKFEVKYIGQAIGLIPETNNAKFEVRLCDDGIEREFLTCEGFVWQKWDDPVDIFNRDFIKSQSMEIHDDYIGEWKDKLFHFTKFSFFGACALGGEVLPAMTGSTIEVQFSQKDMFKDIQEKMESFKQSFSLESEGGSKELDKKLELLKKYAFTEEQLNQKEVKLEEYTLAELETKLKEFSLTSEQFTAELMNELVKEKIKDDWDWEYSRYSYVDHKEGEVFAFDRLDNYKLVGFQFENNGDTIAINFDSKKRKKVEFVDFEDGADSEFSYIPKEILEYEAKIAAKKLEVDFTAKKEDLELKFAKLEEDNKSLKHFQQETLANERLEKENALFESFSSELTEDEVKALREDSSQFSLEQIEEKLYTLVGKKKATFSTQAKKEKKTIKVDVVQEKQTVHPYGGLFEKYLGN